MDRIALSQMRKRDTTTHTRNIATKKKYNTYL